MDVDVTVVPVGREGQGTLPRYVGAYIGLHVGEVANMHERRHPAFARCIRSFAFTAVLLLLRVLMDGRELLGRPGPTAVREPGLARVRQAARGSTRGEDAED